MLVAVLLLVTLITMNMLMLTNGLCEYNHTTEWCQNDGDCLKNCAPVAENECDCVSIRVGVHYPLQRIASSFDYAPIRSDQRTDC
ncbi:hypothetical protein niasHS_008459 [Heterodera schachtii]|uniref:Uncharacterized protein n=1 Tax=Heterodera schachtii TaxID=97005 RepID=A0ABD2J099_HETSC